MYCSGTSALCTVGLLLSAGNMETLGEEQVAAKLLHSFSFPLSTSSFQPHAIIIIEATVCTVSFIIIK